LGETPTAHTVATAAGVTDYNNVPQIAALAGHDCHMTYNLSIGPLQVGPFSTSHAAQHWAETRGFDDWTLVKVSDPCEAFQAVRTVRERRQPVI